METRGGGHVKLSPDRAAVPTEQIRVLLATRRSAIKARVAATRQIKSLLVTTPDSIRTRWRVVSDKTLIAGLAATRSPGATTSVDAATAITLRRFTVGVNHDWVS